MINYNPINGVEFQINKEIDLDSLFKQASIYTENGNIEAAVKLYNKILKIDDKNKKAYFLLGYCYHLTNNFYEALKYYNQVLLIDNYDVDAYNNIGLVFQELKRFKEAEKIFKLSIKIDPSNAILYNNLSVVQKLFWKLDEATQNAELAVQLDKNYLDAQINLGNCYMSLGKYDQSLQTFNKAISINSNSAAAHYNKALVLLKQGNLKNGFLEYEWRMKLDDYLTRYFSKPRLNTTNIYGKRILIHDEQGLGDTIQFSRYLRDIKDLGAYVILECHSEIAGLMQSCAGIDEVLIRKTVNDPNIDYDYYLPLLSTPLFLIANNIIHKEQSPYIIIEQKEINRWVNFFKNYNGKKIGIVWEGKKPINNAHRSCPIEEFAQLTKIKGINFFSLQTKETVRQNKNKMIEYGIIDLSDKINNMNDTAAIIKNLDLIISIDTSVAHLSGAIGQKVWILLSSVSDWRWFDKSHKSPWYPNMRLFRQSKFGDWQSLLSEVKKELLKEFSP